MPLKGSDKMYRLAVSSSFFKSVYSVAKLLSHQILFILSKHSWMHWFSVGLDHAICLMKVLLELQETVTVGVDGTVLERIAKIMAYLRLGSSGKVILCLSNVFLRVYCHVFLVISKLAGMKYPISASRICLGVEWLCKARHRNLGSRAMPLYVFILGDFLPSREHYPGTVFKIHVDVVLDIYFWCQLCKFVLQHLKKKKKDKDSKGEVSCLFLGGLFMGNKFARIVVKIYWCLGISNLGFKIRHLSTLAKHV